MFSRLMLISVWIIELQNECHIIESTGIKIIFFRSLRLKLLAALTETAKFTIYKNLRP
jgi:hypothetical protein